MSGGLTLTKEQCRAGLPPAQRPDAWLALSLKWGREATPPGTAIALPPLDAAARRRATDTYAAALAAVFGSLSPCPPRLFRVPFLGVEHEARAVRTTTAALAAHDRLMCVLAQLHSLRHAPQVHMLATLLLGCLREDEAHAALDALLRGSAASGALVTSRAVEDALAHALLSLAKGYFPRLSAHLDAHPPLRTHALHVCVDWLRCAYCVLLRPLVAPISAPQ